jgi:hypothetical protein
VTKLKAGLHKIRADYTPGGRDNTCHASSSPNLFHTVEGSGFYARDEGSEFYPHDDESGFYPRRDGSGFYHRTTFESWPTIWMILAVTAALPSFFLIASKVSTQSGRERGCAWSKRCAAAVLRLGRHNSLVGIHNGPDMLPVQRRLDQFGLVTVDDLELL